MGIGMQRRVLIVDDSREQLEIFQEYLKDQYEVVCCENGVQAIRSIQETVPDVVLLDIEMPLLDGFDVLKKIRNLEKGLNIPVIGVTGQNSKSAVLKFISLGGNGYLIKPLSPQTLIENIEKYIKEEEQKAREKRILVVDDDMDALRIMQGFLKENYVVTALNSSKPAMDFLYKHKPHLILLDYYRAPDSGVSVFNMIRKLEMAKDVPIAFVTGATDRDILLECAALKPAGLILKPVNKEDLLQKVEQMLQSS